MKKVLAMGLGVILTLSSFSLPCEGKEINGERGQFGRPTVIGYEEDEQTIAEEELLGDMELISLFVEAEAGNQPLDGKCLVVDVVLNRVRSSKFPNTVEGVLYQEGQFSVATNGALIKAAYNMKDSDYEAVTREMAHISNPDVLYFNNCEKVAGTGTPFKVGDQWFNN